MNLFRRCLLSALAGGFFLGGAGLGPAAEQEPPVAPASVLRVYIGTYTQGSSKGIYLAHLDLAKGKLQLAPGFAAELANPSFLAMHPNRPLLYAVGEMDNFGGGKTGAVSALRIEPKTGRLHLLNQKPSGGAGPCHLAVDRSGKFVLVANYGGGSVACLPIEETTAGLATPVAFVQHKGSSANRQRQEGPHAHCVNLRRRQPLRLRGRPRHGQDHGLPFRLGHRQARGQRSAVGCDRRRRGAAALWPFIRAATSPISSMNSIPP